MSTILKYVDAVEVFQEFPDEIALAINISNCPNFCKGCHSSYLAEDIGTVLSEKELDKLIKDHPGISCIGFMGGDANPRWITNLAIFVKQNHPKLKVGWYSGKDNIPYDADLRFFDYLKLGPWESEHGPLSDPSTNQAMYKIENGLISKDLTYRFQKHGKA